MLRTAMVVLAGLCGLALFVACSSDQRREALG